MCKQLNVLRKGGGGDGKWRGRCGRVKWRNNDSRIWEVEGCIGGCAYTTLLIVFFSSLLFFAGSPSDDVVTMAIVVNNQAMADRSFFCLPVFSFLSATASALRLSLDVAGRQLPPGCLLHPLTLDGCPLLQFMTKLTLTYLRLR